jgi:hypothetical protein
VTETYGDPDENDWQNCKTAYVEQIVGYYATKYGADIDGWWFDQGRYIDRPLLEKACHEGNPNAVIAINNGQKVPLQVNNAPLEDFTFGHPNPITRTRPSDPKNLPMINSIESTPDGFMTRYNWDVLEHMFMPMGTTWNAIARSRTSLEWDESQALDWMSRALLSGGAWTWNIPREDYYPISQMSILRTDFVDFLNVVVDQLAPSSAPSLVPSSKPSQLPSASPSSVPSLSTSPSFQPSSRPSFQPSSQPSRSLTPSFSPSEEPSASKVPSLHPSWAPSLSPSFQPSSWPSFQPSSQPSRSLTPSFSPSEEPSASKVPSLHPSRAPSLSAVPSYVTSASPSNSPSFEPFSHSVCQTFAVHAGAALTFADNTIKSGNVGAGAAITGLSTLLDGEIVDESNAFAADTVALHTALMAVRSDGIPMSGNIGGLTFKPGTYRSDAAITIGSNVILDGDGYDNSVFLFQALSMATAASTSIVLTNGATAENVLWVLGGASAHGASSVFEGSIVAGAAVTFGAGCALHGCVLSLAAITFGAGGSVEPRQAPQVITAPVVPAPTPPTSPSTPAPTIVKSLSSDVCENFAVHAGAALTFADNTIKSGNVGAGAAITGLSTLLDGEIVDESNAFAADTVALHTALMAVRSDGIPMSGNIGGLTFKPGTYRSDAAITIGSNVILDGDGYDNSVFLFQALSMATAASTSIVLTNGATAENVLWVLGGASAHGASSVFEGSIVAGAAVTFGAGCALHGCVLSLAAITFGAGGSVDTRHDIGEAGLFARDGSTGSLRGTKR